MLRDSKLQAIVCTEDIGRAEDFFSNVLGLELVGRSHGALVYSVGGTDLRVSPVPETSPSEHTIVGFAVDDLDEVVRVLVAKGIVTERFANFSQDPRGVLEIPGGDRVAWFRDPDGNLFSIVEYAR